MRVLVGLAALSALALAPFAAGAATISYTQAFPGGSENSQGYAKTDWDGSTQSVTLPQFDPARGTLTGVDLQLYGEIASSGSLTNNTQGIIDIDTYTATMQISLLAPGLADPLTVSPAEFNFSSTSLAPGRSLTFGGDAPVPANDSNSVSATSLDPYIGTGSLQFPLTAATDSTVITTGGNLDFVQNTAARAEVTVIYTFDEAATPVPEPASAALLGAGLLGFGLLRRRS